MAPPSPEVQTGRIEVHRPLSLRDEAKLERIRACEKPTPRTWGATPLNPYRADVLEQQAIIEAEMDLLFTEDLPDDVPSELAADIHALYMGRREHRRARNFESFQHRGVINLRSGHPELVRMTDDAISGYASPAEIHLVGKYHEIPTIEWASVSVPFGKRMEYPNSVLDAMRRSVNEAILIHEGVFLETPPYYKVVGFRHTITEKDGHKTIIPCLSVTRTYDLALLNDESVVHERSSFDVPIDALFSVNPSLASEIMRTVHSGKLSDIETLRELEGFEDTMTMILETDRHDIARPVSVTTFEVNLPYCEKYLEDDAYRRFIEHQKRFDKDTNYAAIKLRAQQAISEMLDEVQE